MFTISKMPNSKEFKNNSTNHAFLAKKIIKVIRFFAYREKPLNDSVNNVKYNHIIHIIRKSLENKKTEETIFEDLIKNLTFYIQEKTNINEDILEEIFSLFFSSITNQKVIKKELLEKINSNISALDDFFSQDVYDDKKRKKSDKLKVETIREIICKKECSDFYNFFKIFYNSLVFYNRLLNSEYHYVLKPNFLINYCYLFSDKFLTEYKEILKKLNLYKNILFLKKLLVDYTNNLNLELFMSNKNIDPSFYLQENKSDSYIEKDVLNYNFYCSYHGGERFDRFTKDEEPKLRLKRKEMEEKFKNSIFLKSIVFHKLHLLDLETHNDCFLFEVKKKSKSLFLMNEEYEIFDIYNTSPCYKIKIFTYQNNIKIIKEDLKQDFLFKNEQDYCEIVLEDNKENNIFKVRFYINKYQIIDIINKQNIEHYYGYTNI